nr:hypothetical protein [Mycoplasmopsis bovis]QQH18988.1 hypothetical protein HYE48_00900 [Mycoplasmopsis bovis]
MLDKQLKEIEDSMNVDHTIVGNSNQALKNWCNTCNDWTSSTRKLQLFNQTFNVFDTVKTLQEKYIICKLKNTWAKELILHISHY